jgi:hypothetical protein
LVLEELIQRIDHADAFCARLADAITDLLPRWMLAPVVEVLQMLRGVSMPNQRRWSLKSADSIGSAIRFS